MIERNNNMLANLTEQNIDAEPRRKRRRLGVHFKHIQQYAKDLYRALERHCKRSDPRHINLQLDPRIYEEKHGSVQEEDMLFRVAFLLRPSRDDQKTVPQSARWQETEIRLFDSSDHGSQEAFGSSISAPSPYSRETHATTTVQPHNHSIFNSSTPSNSCYKDEFSIKKPKKKGVRLLLPKTPSQPPISGSAVAKGHKGQLTSAELAQMAHIGNLCEELRTVRMDRNAWASDLAWSSRCLGYLTYEGLDCGNRLGIFLSTAKTDQATLPASKLVHQIVSLQQLLTRQHNRFQNPTMSYVGNLALTRGERLGLALTVASSALQLCQTPWLPEHWNKSGIMVNLDGTANNDQKKIF